MSTLAAAEIAEALEADRGEIARFYDAIFRYAALGGYISLRGFYHEPERPAFYGGRHSFPCVRVGDPNLVDQVANVVTWMAQRPRGAVFCPPVATLTNDEHAREEDIAEGLAISVECDQHPAEARTKIEHLLGRATIAMGSGGEYLNRETGNAEPKLHLHWRLSEPTCNQNEHRLLKQARRLATQYVNADGSAEPVVHPLRWPGSWHRKDIKHPRLAKIIAETSNEIELRDALDLLQEATVDSNADGGASKSIVDALSKKRPDEYWRRLAEGVKQGTSGRVTAITSIFGYMLRLGMEPHLAVSLGHAYNEKCCKPALDEDKVDRALENILKMDMRR
ncbi:MAG TPA: hypothetical protein VMU87_16290 [Stellaceae bacterium]|nr:hypothetical protein [Stellaceae bacterium]